MDLDPLLKGCRVTVSGKDLKSLLTQDSPLVAALAEVAKAAEDKLRAMANADLTSDQGRLAAIKAQGEVKGLQMAIEMIGEMAEEQNDDTGQ